MSVLLNLISLPLRLGWRLVRSTAELEASDPLRTAIDKGWLYCKYGALTLFIVLNLSIVSGVPHLRLDSTVHTSRSGEAQGESNYIGPFGFRIIEAAETGPVPPRIAFIPVYKIFEH